MKNLSLLTKEINERLQTDVMNVIMDIHDTMQNLIINNHLTLLEINYNRLTTAINKESERYRFKLKDFMTDRAVKSIIEDKLIGFPVASKMSKTINKTLSDISRVRIKELDPECLPYFYKDEANNMYFVGLVIFDPTVDYVDEFAHILNFEASKCVENPDKLLDVMYEYFTLHYLPENIAKFKGLTAKPTDPIFKNVLLKLGFRPLKDNPDIYSTKI